MNDTTITSAQYVAGLDGNNSSIKAVIDGETLYVPLDPANRHYAGILDWVAEGNTIKPADSDA